MYLSEGIYTTLTWAQLVIGLIIGLAPIILTIAVKRILYRRELAERDRVRDANPAMHMKGPAEVPKAPPADATKIIGLLQGIYYTLASLEKHERPIFFGTLVKSIHEAQTVHKCENLLAPSSIRTILERLITHGDVLLGEDGFVTTARGRKLLMRVATLNGESERYKSRIPRISSGAALRDQERPVLTTPSNSSSQFEPGHTGLWNRDFARSMITQPRNPHRLCRANTYWRNTQN